MITLLEKTETGADRHPQRPSLALLGCGRNEAGLRSALETAGARVRSVDTEDVVRVLAEGRGRLLVVGPEVTGHELLDLVRTTAAAGGRILYLAPRPDLPLAGRILAAGAEDVLPPPHSAQAVLFRAALMKLRGRRSRWSNRARTLEFGERRLDREGRRLTGGGEPVSLSAREFELLERLLQEDGGVVRRATLLRDIWGEDQDSEGVLEATVHRLRQKLERNVSEPRHLTTVRGVGYRLEPGSADSRPSGSSG